MPRTKPDPIKTQDDDLDYGEGPRADYGEGYRYRKADLSKGADKANNLGGFAGGKRPEKELPDPQEPDGD